MNKYKVVIRNRFDGLAETVLVEADSFYVESGNATFTAGKYVAGSPNLPEVVSYYRGVESIKKLEDE